MQEIYPAFGQGNIPVILEHMAEEVDWEYAYRETPNPLPWLQPRTGKTGVARFFESLGALEFHHFVPKVLLGRSRLERR